MQVFINIAIATGNSPKGNGTDFLVAVFEHAVFVPSNPPSPGEAIPVMMKNLEVYESGVAQAAIKGVKLIVFPEDGVYGTVFTRGSIKPFLENIPDPGKEVTNPCVNDSLHHLVVQQKLSCMARNYSIYVVANVGDKVYCEKETDSKCPSDGQYQYNTNVVYDQQGNLVAKYHKKNLFYEDQ